MRYYENRRLIMLTRMTNLLMLNREKLASKVPAMNGLIGDFNERVEAIKINNTYGKRPIMLSAQSKKIARKALSEIILRLSGILRAHQFQHYGSTTREKKAGSKREVIIPPYTMTALNRATTDNLCKVSELVINAVKKIKFGHLYGITREDIKDAEAYYREFAEMKYNPKVQIKKTAKRNKQLTTDIKACVAILENSMDPLMRIAAKDDWEMQLNYKTFRVVMPRGSGRMSEKEAAYRKSRERKEKPQHDDASVK